MVRSQYPRWSFLHLFSFMRPTHYLSVSVISDDQRMRVIQLIFLSIFTCNNYLISCCIVFPFNNPIISITIWNIFLVIFYDIDIKLLNNYNENVHLLIDMNYLKEQNEYPNVLFRINIKLFIGLKLQANEIYIQP
jgi:hypothetical protein